ncbi:Heptaprenyl diphosphate synthase component 2 [compost metagenome]
MASCLEIGARAAEASESVYSLLYQFGEKLGMAFQIRDDVLDFVQTSNQLGKPAGNDLGSGQVTLPVLYALQDNSCASIIRSIHADSKPEELQAAIDAISNSDALAKTEALSNQYLTEAQSIIEQLVDFPAHRDLQALLNYFSGRDY